MEGQGRRCGWPVRCSILSCPTRRAGQQARGQPRPEARCVRRQPARTPCRPPAASGDRSPSRLGVCAGLFSAPSSSKSMSATASRAKPGVLATPCCMATGWPTAAIAAAAACRGCGNGKLGSPPGATRWPDHPAVPQVVPQVVRGIGEKLELSAVDASNGVNNKGWPMTRWQGFLCCTGCMSASQASIIRIGSQHSRTTRDIWIARGSAGSASLLPWLPAPSARPWHTQLTSTAPSDG